MKCTKCGQHWSPQNTTKETSCPRCGGTSDPQGLSEAFWLIYASVGPDFLQDNQKLVSVFADVAPDLKAERKQVDMLVSLNGPQRIHAAIQNGELEPAIRILCRDLEEECSMDPGKAEILCRSFADALSGRIYVSAASDKKAEKSPKKRFSEPKELPVSKPDNTADNGNIPSEDPIPGETLKETTQSKDSMATFTKVSRWALALLSVVSAFLIVGIMYNLEPSFDQDTADAYRVLLSRGLPVFLLQIFYLGMYARKKAVSAGKAAASLIAGFVSSFAIFHLFLCYHYCEGYETIAGWIVFTLAVFAGAQYVLSRMPEDYRTACYHSVACVAAGCSVRFLYDIPYGRSFHGYSPVMNLLGLVLALLLIFYAIMQFGLLNKFKKPDNN